MTPEQAAQLRAPFLPETIGKLPRITCRACSKADGRVCGEHHKSKCATCGNYITGSHIHLDYVGHAAVTERLLSVDPEWSWHPLGANEDGTPKIQREDGESVLWIEMTVCGVTRPGVGIASGFELEKQLISDAIRNAAMRFGVALDLWSKEDLSATSEEGSVLRDSARTVKEADAPSRTVESSGVPLPAISDAPAPEPPGEAIPLTAPPVAVPQPPVPIPNEVFTSEVSQNQIKRIQERIGALNAIKGFAFSERRKAAGLPLLTKAVTPDVFADFVALVNQCEEEMHVRARVS